MSKKMNRSYILQSVVSKNGSWNSDFEHMPKEYSGGFFASDRALKFAARTYFDQTGETLLIKKWVNSDGDIIGTTGVKQEISGGKEEDFKNRIWRCMDVRQFGMVYENIAITGVAQVSQGIDAFKRGELYEDDLTGRMNFEKKNQKNKKTDPEKQDMTRGMATRTHLSEAHFVYLTSVNPKNVEFMESFEKMDPPCIYQTTDYDTLKQALWYGPTVVKSTQKMNCRTSFMLTVDLVDTSIVHLADLQSLLVIEQEKDDSGRVVYDVSRIGKYLKEKETAAGGELYEAIELNIESYDIALKGEEHFPSSYRVVPR